MEKKNKDKKEVLESLLKDGWKKLYEFDEKTDIYGKGLYRLLYEKQWGIIIKEYKIENAK